ncbi:MAG TPA: D-alanyl-D-alanine carboxypeptidase, partial [Candidatus Baltobacteraceae bacterium]|nr:D-alanyl-D-alanine carboxypeptidase [Candidatus Baltobacteraceae bacterium]
VTFTNGASTGPARSANTIAMPADVDDGAGNRRVAISGSMPLDSHPIVYAYAVPSARRFAEVALTQALTESGVSVAHSASGALVDVKTFSALYVAGNIIATHTSPPLAQDVKVTLKVSDNLHAAMMPYLWGALLAHDTTDPQAAGFRLEHGFLTQAGFDASRFVQNDGEGANAFFAPAQIVRFLAYVRGRPYYPYIYRGLPVMGVDGTLFNIQNHAAGAGKIHAKTGTNGTSDMLNSRFFLTGKGLVGYMTSRSGRHIAFCLYVNNFSAPANQDLTRTAGQILGEMANDGYLDL